MCGQGQLSVSGGVRVKTKLLGGRKKLVIVKKLNKLVVKLSWLVLEWFGSRWNNLLL